VLEPRLTAARASRIRSTASGRVGALAARSNSRHPVDGHVA
jgi:hypothetical protein